MLLLDCIDSAGLLIQEKCFSQSRADFLLLDRWYPSDAVFRRHVDVTAVIQANLDAGCPNPDLALAVTCDATVPWERALKRTRRLDSKVIETFDEHAESTKRFEDLAQHFGLAAASDGVRDAGGAVQQGRCVDRTDDEFLDAADPAPANLTQAA